MSKVDLNLEVSIPDQGVMLPYTVYRDANMTAIYDTDGIFKVKDHNREGCEELWEVVARLLGVPPQVETKTTTIVLTKEPISHEVNIR